jgi:hypothetical protein
MLEAGSPCLANAIRRDFAPGDAFGAGNCLSVIPVEVTNVEFDHNRLDVCLQIDQY